MGILKKHIKYLLNYYNYELIRLSSEEKIDKNKVLINIGSGDWSHIGWINLDYPSEWYKKVQKNHQIIAFDIRKDKIPFANSSVDVIYCSHVIEHIENEYIENLFTECFRVLKAKGIMRITCPDAEFLYQVSKIGSTYWQWRNEWFKSVFYKGGKPRPVDYLVREIATPQLLGYVNSINNIDYFDAFQSMGMNDFFEYLTHKLEYRVKYPGDHINYWSFEKISKMLSKIGFETVIRSKWSGSICREMTSIAKFDITYPKMSLYVDIVK
jgi:SAM-dependent methyltransferase